MNHTDKEAAELWCPMVRIARNEVVEPERVRSVAGGFHQVEQEVRTIVAGCNTDALGRNRVPASCCCIGSKCAMWRIQNTTPSRRRSISCPSPYQWAEYEPKRPDNVPDHWVFSPFDDADEDCDGACWYEPGDEDINLRLGYCGLAGKPGAQ